jgi:hypothetical protein
MDQYTVLCGISRIRKRIAMSQLGQSAPNRNVRCDGSFGEKPTSACVAPNAVHAALLLLMLEAVPTDLVSTSA